MYSPLNSYVYIHWILDSIYIYIIIIGTTSIRHKLQKTRNIVLRMATGCTTDTNTHIFHGRVALHTSHIIQKPQPSTHTKLHNNTTSNTHTQETNTIQQHKLHPRHRQFSQWIWVLSKRGEYYSVYTQISNVSSRVPHHTLPSTIILLVTSIMGSSSPSQKGSIYYMHAA